MIVLNLFHSHNFYRIFCCFENKQYNVFLHQNSFCFMLNYSSFFSIMKSKIIFILNSNHKIYRLHTKNIKVLNINLNHVGSMCVNKSADNTRI